MKTHGMPLTTPCFLILLQQYLKAQSGVQQHLLPSKELTHSISCSEVWTHTHIHHRDGHGGKKSPMVERNPP